MITRIFGHSVLAGLVAAAGLLMTAPEADAGGFGRIGYGYAPVVVARPPIAVYRPPVAVYRPPVAVYRAPVHAYRPHYSAYSSYRSHRPSYGYGVPASGFGYGVRSYRPAPYYSGYRGFGGSGLSINIGTGYRGYGGISPIGYGGFGGYRSDPRQFSASPCHHRLVL